jgi:hypothetical protein
VSDDGRHVVVRPFVYVSEEEARLYTKACGLPIIGCCCPVCGDLSLQRQRIKRLLIELEREHPGVKASMLKALGNVMPRHLLDRRLHPLDDVEDGPRDTRSERPADGGDGDGDGEEADARPARPGTQGIIPLVPVGSAAMRTLDDE